VDFHDTCIVIARRGYRVEDEHQEEAVDAICGGEQGVPTKHIVVDRVDVRRWRVREEGAVTAEWVVHAELRGELVDEMAKFEEDEATMGGEGIVLVKELIGEA
jgi:hypothetical protein